MLGPARVIPRELPGITCRLLDVDAARRRAAVRPPGARPRADRGTTRSRASPSGCSRTSSPRRPAPSPRCAASKRLELEFAPAAAAARRRTGAPRRRRLPDHRRLRRHRPERRRVAGARLPARGSCWSAGRRCRRGPAGTLQLRRHGPNDPTSPAHPRRAAARGARRRGAGRRGRRLQPRGDARRRRRGDRALRRHRRRDPRGRRHRRRPAAGQDARARSRTCSSPKVHGTMVLDELFPDGSLDWLVLFSSTSTITAPAGQVDYVAANEFLERLRQEPPRRPDAGRRHRLGHLERGRHGRDRAGRAHWATRRRPRASRPRRRCSTPRASTTTGHRIFERRFPPPATGCSTSTAPRRATRCCRAPATSSWPRGAAGARRDRRLRGPRPALPAAADGRRTAAGATSGCASPDRTRATASRCSARPASMAATPSS